LAETGLCPDPQVEQVSGIFLVYKPETARLDKTELCLPSQVAQVSGSFLVYKQHS
jgi:hypothetical protein